MNAATRTPPAADVPLLTSDELALLVRLSRGPASLLEHSFGDALTLKRHGLIAIDRATDQLVLTPDGRRFLTAGP